MPASLVVAAALSAGLITSVQDVPTPRLTAEDVVRLESFGAASASPDGAWALYERRGPYASAVRFDTGRRANWTVTSLFLLDLREPSASSRPVLEAAGGVGYAIGPWAPTGDRVVVYRFDGSRLELGVLEAASGTVTWTGVTPDMPVMGVATAWAGSDRLIVTARPAGDLPIMLRWDGGGQIATARLWNRMSEGRTSSATILDTDGGVASTDEPKPLVLTFIGLAAGEVRPLFEGRVQDIEVSPDGRLAAVRSEGDAMPLDPSSPLQQSRLTRRGRLQLIELETADVVASGAFDVAPHLMRWSPDSRRLLVWGREPGRSWREGRLASVSPSGAVWLDATGLDPLAEDGDIDALRGVRADWVGGRPALYARRIGEDRFDWWSLDPLREPRNLTAAITGAPPSRLAATGSERSLAFADGAVWKLSADGAKALSSPGLGLREAAAPSILTPVRQRINAAPNQSWAIGLGTGGRIVWLDDVGEAGSAATPCSQPRVQAETATTTLLACRSGVRETLWRISAAHDAVRLDEVNSKWSHALISRSTPLAHADHAGRSVRSWLHRPREGEPVKGLVVLIYPGSVDDGDESTESLRLGPSAALLTAQGYAVLSPAVSTSHDDADFHFAAGVDRALKAALAAAPDLPADRVALLGHSFGGYAALVVAARTSRFRSVIVWAGFSDLFGQWGEFSPLTRSLPTEALMIGSQMGAVETGQADLQAPPWRSPDAFVAASPFLAADRIAAPMLLITSDRDFVPMSQAERMFSAAHRQGRRARIVTYWGEGHTNWSPANIVDVQHQITRWLDETMAVPARPATNAEPDEPPNS